MKFPKGWNTWRTDVGKQVDQGEITTYHWKQEQPHSTY